MRDVQQDDTVDAEAEQHGRRHRPRRPTASLIREPHSPQHHDQRERRGQRPDGDQPHASEGDVEQRQDERERTDRVENAIRVRTDGFGLDRNPVPPANSTRNGGAHRSILGGSVTRAARIDATMSRRRASRARENAASYGGRLRAGDHQTAAAVVGDVSVLADAEVQAGLRAAERVAQEIVQTDRILLHQLRDLGRRNAEQLAPGGDGASIPSGEGAGTLRRAPPSRRSSNCRSASHPKSRVWSTTPVSTRVISGAARSAATHVSI